MNGSKACYWLDRSAVFRKHALTARTHSTLILTLTLNLNPNILIIICCFVFFNVSARLYSFSVTCRCFLRCFFFFCFVFVFCFFRFRGLLIVLFYFDIFCTHLMHRWYRYFSDWNICFLYTFNECILGLFTCWNVNHHSVLSIVILIMLIIVTVSSQDTALYIKLHWIHFCYCTQGLKFLPFLKESTLNEYNICQI